MVNVIRDIQSDDFHYDFLLAALVAIVWIRCVLILRLTLLFGPTVVMIQKMIKIITYFLFIQFILLITFASVANMTLSEASNFDNLFDSFR